MAVRFAPWLFRLRPPAEGEVAEPAKDALVNLPHRMVFAVATMEEVIVYDTQDLGKPVAVVGGLHLATLTDIAWLREDAPGGGGPSASKFLHRIVVSSSDGFCSVITFDEGELGEALPEEEYPVEMTLAAQSARGDAGLAATDGTAVVAPQATAMEVDAVAAAAAAKRAQQSVLQDNSNGEKPAKRRIAPVAM